MTCLIVIGSTPVTQRLYGTHFNILDGSGGFRLGGQHLNALPPSGFQSRVLSSRHFEFVTTLGRIHHFYIPGFVI